MPLGIETPREGCASPGDSCLLVTLDLYFPNGVTLKFLTATSLGVPGLMRWTSLFFLLCAAISTAQTVAPDRTADASAIQILKLGNVEFSGSLRSRVEGFDWFTASSGSNAYAYSGNILRFGFSQRTETWEWNAEFAVPFLLGLPGNPLGPGTQGGLGFGANYLSANHGNQNTAMLFPKQLYARFMPFGSAKAHAIKLGRFEFFDGSEAIPKDPTLSYLKSNRAGQRLIGTFGFTDVARIESVGNLRDPDRHKNKEIGRASCRESCLHCMEQTVG